MRCGEVRFELTDRPFAIHGCRCSYCQRETGSAFAVNALIESDRVRVLERSPEAHVTASASGQGQTILRCPRCNVALWSNDPGFGEHVTFVRVGTLEARQDLAPQVHIFTSTRLEWLDLPAHSPRSEGMYPVSDLRVLFGGTDGQRWLACARRVHG
nr:GFA family protein [Qipengyuania proteolytica]